MTDKNKEGDLTGYERNLYLYHVSKHLSYRVDNIVI